ncbi:MAG: MGMT family protein [Actinobacteria bacterium]|nr:MGMT family protein [Actinomycetota bacterium]
MSEPEAFERAVVAAVRRLRSGDIASYGEIAQEAGSPRAARAVGNILARTEGLPWWRVVRSDGRLASPKVKEQARRLRAEGVEIVDGKVGGR